jgi:hypothetical protein
LAIGTPAASTASIAAGKVPGRGAPFSKLYAVTSQNGGKSLDLPENDAKIVRFKSENAEFHHQ